MSNSKVYDPPGPVLTRLILDLFTLNNRLLAEGDRLVADLGLTSARWQVLRVVEMEKPQPVAWLARAMSANRQNVQRIVNDLERGGFVAFEPNPHHLRAQLVVLTEKGRAAYRAALKLQEPWVKDLADGMTLVELEIAQRVAVKLLAKLELPDASLKAVGRLPAEIPQA